MSTLTVLPSRERRRRWTSAEKQRASGAPPSQLHTCRPMRIAATTSCTTPRVLRGQSPPHSAGPMRDGSSSSWQTSPPMLGAGRMHRRSRRSRLKRSSALTRCSTLSAASMGKAPKSACGCGESRVRRFWRNWKRGCASSARASQAPHRLPNRSTTCCGAGSGLLDSSTMVGSA